MKADITDRFVLLARLDRRLSLLARLRTVALFGLLLGALLLLFAGQARPAQPLLPWIAGGLMGGATLPLLLVCHFLFKVTQHAHRALVRHLFRQGHRVEYPEFQRVEELPLHLRLETHVQSTR